MKKFMCVALVIVFLFGATVTAYAWGNESWFDTAYTFRRVRIDMKGGEVLEGVCESWKDFENSDVVQVKVDGEWYSTHYLNVVLCEH